MIIGGADVARGPVGAWDRARRLGEVAGLDVAAVLRDVAEKDGVNEVVLRIEHQIAMPEQHKNDILPFALLVRQIDI